MSEKTTYSIGQFRSQEVSKDVIGTLSDNYYSPLCEIDNTCIEINSNAITGTSSNNNFLVPALKMNKQYVCSQKGEIVLALDSDSFTKNKVYYARIGVKKNSKYPCNYNIKLINDKKADNTNTQLLKYIQTEQTNLKKSMNHNVVLFQPYYYTVEKKQNYDIWYVDYDSFIVYTIYGTLSSKTAYPDMVLKCLINNDELPYDDIREIAYVWYRGTDIVSKTDTYQVKDYDIGETIRCEILLVNNDSTKYPYDIVQPEPVTVLSSERNIYMISSEALDNNYYTNKSHVNIYKINADDIKTGEVDIYTNKHNEGE